MSLERARRSLKHQWLFLHPLDSVATVRRLVAFYVDQHNRVIPHAAFRGLTPDEMYFGTAAPDASDLAVTPGRCPCGETAGQACSVLSGVSRSPAFGGPARPGVSRWGPVARTRAKSYPMSLERAALLALVDAVRSGRARERRLAEEALRQWLQEMSDARPEPRAARARR